MKSARRTVLMLALVAGLSAVANATYYINESFRNSTASGWTFVNGQGYGPELTANTGVDPEGDGWLRLTRDEWNQASFVYCNTSIPTSAGLQFVFDFVIWGQGETGVADGLTLSIFDADVTPDAGAYGGSLGYAQRSGIDGLAGAVVGFGFDEFGNFSNPTEGRIGGPGKVSNAIAIRGSMGADRTEGYEYIAGTGTLDAFSTYYTTNRSDATIHSVRITIPTNKHVTIEWKTEGESWETILDHQCNLDCPDNIRFGYTAGTGAVRGNHEIRNLSVSSVSAVPEPTSISLLLCACAVLRLYRKKT